MVSKVRNSEPLASTWAVIEAKGPLPAAIAVVGATGRDDIAGTARGLAQAALAAGHRTAFLSLSGLSVRSDYDNLILPQATGAAYNERAQLWRTQYEVLIIEVPSVLATTLGPQVVRSATGVVVALRADRRLGEEDLQLSAFLQRLGVITFGVVRTGAIEVVNDAQLGVPFFNGMRRTLRSIVSRS